MDLRITKWFVYSTGAIMLIAAALRFSILAQNTHLSRLVLKAHDPVLSFTIRQEVWAVAVAELAVAAICFWNFKLQIRVLIIAWIMSNYFVFRAGLFWMNIKVQSSCIGGLSDPWHVAQGLPGRLLNYIPYGLATVAYGLLFWWWYEHARQKKQSARALQEIQAGIVKTSCQSCGGHIKFNAINVGQKIACPHCQNNLTLRRTDEKLKMACFFCSGHIEYPAHAIGGKIHCPHCKMDITLNEPA